MGFLIKNPHQKGLLITLTGVLILTPDTLIMRLIGAEHLTIAFWRGLLLGLVYFIGAYMVYGNALWANIRQSGLIGAAMGFCFGAANFFFISALYFTSVANLLIIFALTPLWSAIFSRLIMQEKLALPTLFAIIFSLFGILIVFYDGIQASHNGGIGEIFALMACLAFSMNLTLARYRKAVNIYAVNGMGSILMGLMVAPFATSLVMPTPDFMLTLFLCVILLPLSFALILYGPRFITSAEVGLLLLIETVLGPYWVWLVIGETPSNSTLIGGVIVLATLLCHTLWRLKHSPSKISPSKT